MFEPNHPAVRARPGELQLERMIDSAETPERGKVFAQLERHARASGQLTQQGEETPALNAACAAFLRSLDSDGWTRGRHISDLAYACGREEIVRGEL
jgi:hypothetical protein